MGPAGGGSRCSLEPRFLGCCSSREGTKDRIKRRGRRSRGREAIWWWRHFLLGCCSRLVRTRHSRRIGHEVPPVAAQRQLQDPSAGILANWQRPRNLHLVARDLLQPQSLVRASWYSRLVGFGSGFQALPGTLGPFAVALEIKAPNVELHLVAIATEHRYRKTLRPNTLNCQPRCCSELEPRRQSLGVDMRYNDVR